MARPIRRYLRDREDTARVIVSSLLADIEDEAGNRIDLGPDISAEIAAEMLNPVASNVQEKDQELNWTDMNWMPDPVDASPEYKKSKSENVLAYLLSLYDREDFINELKNILGEHLLKNEDSDFEKEVSRCQTLQMCVQAKYSSRSVCWNFSSCALATTTYRPARSCSRTYSSRSA